MSLTMRSKVRRASAILATSSVTADTVVDDEH
jgi:hypothetical protein